MSWAGNSWVDVYVVSGGSSVAVVQCHLEAPLEMPVAMDTEVTGKHRKKYVSIRSS